MNINENKESKPPKKSKRLKSLRIIIIEPRGRYCRTVWIAIASGISQVMFGATVMTVLLYSLQKNDLHAVLLSVAVKVFLLFKVNQSVILVISLSFLTINMRVLILDAGGEYWNVMICTFVVGISQMLIGGTLTIILYYSISTNFNDKHIMLCTYGYHFFSAEAILSLNYANGWSTPMRLRHRRFTHVFLNICAMICAITGTVLITLDKGLSTNPHGLTGGIAAALACITFLLGPCALFAKSRYGKIIHASFGMPTFIMSSISFCCGLFTPAFKDWAPEAVVYTLVGFIIFYTSFIMTMCFIKCTSMI